MAIVYVETKTLPDTIVTVLRTMIGYARPNIGVYVSETASVHAPSGDGMRGFTILLDIDSGARELHHGSWGGPNMFTHNPVDSDTRERALPPGACVISGHEGGGKPVYATLTIHPSRAAKLLPIATDDLTIRQACLMACYARLNSRGRSEWFARNGAPTDSEVSDLVTRGWIKRNKAGAVTCTAAGKNVAPSDCYLYRHEKTG